MKYKKEIVKYLIDILIITIGVIAAFSLTKYGESINRAKNEKAIINQIYFELKDNLKDLENDFVIHKTGLISHLNILKSLERKSPLPDSLLFDYYWMTRDEYIFANTSGYENLKSFGVNMVQDDSLRELITLIYNYDFPRLTKGQTIHPDLYVYFSDFIKHNFRANRDTSLSYTLKFNDSLQITYPREIGLGTKQFVGYVPLDKEKLLKDEAFYLMVSDGLQYRMYKYTFYGNCINNVKKALARIEEKYQILSK